MFPHHLFFTELYQFVLFSIVFSSPFHFVCVCTSSSPRDVAAYNIFKILCHIHRTIPLLIYECFLTFCLLLPLLFICIWPNVFLSGGNSHFLGQFYPRLSFAWRLLWRRAAQSFTCTVLSQKPSHQMCPRPWTHISPPFSSVRMLICAAIWQAQFRLSSTLPLHTRLARRLGCTADDKGGASTWLPFSSPHPLFRGWQLGLRRDTPAASLATFL